MIQNPNYVLKEIADVAYLLPTGQEIADFKKGLKLNATSAYIWELLKNDLSLKELMDALIIHYEADAKEAEALKKDVTAFVQLLSSHGMLLWEDRIPEGRDGLWHTLTIAGLGLSLYGNGELFSDRLLPFCTPVTDPLPAADLTVSVLIGSPAVRKNGRVIVRNRELIIMEDEEHFILLFPSEPQILEAHLRKDASFYTIYCIPPVTEKLREALFCAIRVGFLYLAQKKGMAVLHSASVLFEEKAYLFSGPSGTGKSTHTNLWHSLYDTPILNGDLNLLAFENRMPVVHGIPWCGTSGICTTETHPLGGIVILRQDREDFVNTLSLDKQILSVTNRMITPNWTHSLFEKNLQFASGLSACIPIVQLHCTPTRHAVEVMREYLKTTAPSL